MGISVSCCVAYPILTSCRGCTKVSVRGVDGRWKRPPNVLWMCLWPTRMMSSMSEGHKAGTGSIGEVEVVQQVTL